MEGGRIGTYTIHRKLGEGGMGTVYLGEHTLLGRRAAIKVLLPTMSANQEIVNRFFNEARATTSIADPGIVQIFDFGYHTDGSAYIVMELLEGESLEARLRRVGRFVPRDAFRLMRQIASSLSAAHARGIVHRDLKPDNLFVVGDAAVTGGERTKILDFGIAKLAGDDPGRMKTRTGSVMGTPLYMSPEQCRGVATIDHRADIYSLGCVLFVTLTGRAPFDGEGVGDIMFGHMGVQPSPPSAFVPGLPHIVDQIVLRCLAKGPHERFQSMHELGAAMAAAESQLYDLAGSGHHPRPVTAPTALGNNPSAVTTFSSASGQAAATQPPARSSSRGVLFGVIGVALAGGVIAVVLTAGGGDKDPAPTTQPAAATMPATEPTSPPPPPPPPAVDAAVAATPPTVDAAVVAAPSDAAIDTMTTITQTPEPAKTPKKTLKKGSSKNAVKPKPSDTDRSD